MGIHNITEDGMLHWICQGRRGKCQKKNTIHISHEAVRFAPLHNQKEVDALPEKERLAHYEKLKQEGEYPMVVFPPCPGCGGQMSVKVHFTEEELAADSMIEYGMVPTEMTLPHALTGEQIPVMIPALKPIGANPAIAKHQELARQMKALGKHPPERKTP